jgi:glycosyltransferase involved in cell wall biosynthesis
MREADSDLNPLSGLLIVDHPGHILERIALGWQRYAADVQHQVVASCGIGNFSLCQRAARASFVHWVDQLRYVPCASALNVPQVVMVHHLVADMQKRLLPLLECCDAISTASRYWQGKLQALTGRRVHLLPYCVDTCTFRPAADRNAIRKAAGINEGQFVLGYVGKAKADHAGRKGMDLLLAVVEGASRMWSDLSFVLVGPGWENLAGSIQSLGVRVRRYEFTTTDETAQPYWLMDAMLVTSKAEGGPCTVLEAMSAGVPVISSLVGHIPEIVRDGENGFVCKNREPEEYLRAIRSLRERPDLRSRVIAEARETMLNERDERVTIPRLDFVSMYAEAIAYFRRRSAGDLAARGLHRGKLWVRQTARQVLEAGERILGRVP